MQCLLYHNQLWTWCKVSGELWSVLGASRMSKLSDDHHLRARLTFLICDPVWTKRFSNSDKLSHLSFSQSHPSRCPAWSHFTDSACPENILNVWCSLQCNCFGRSVGQLWPINTTSCDAQEIDSCSFSSSLASNNLQPQGKNIYAVTTALPTEVHSGWPALGD